MVIKNGNTSNADEVLNAMGSLFNDTAQNLFNADYIGFAAELNNTGVPPYKNVIYETGLYYTYTGGFTELYDFSGVVVDTEYWTTSAGLGCSVTQGGEKIIVASIGQNSGSQGTAILISDGTTGIPFITSDYVFKYDYSISSGGDNSSGHIRIGIYDGSTTVNLVSVSSPGAGDSFDGRLNIDKTGETANLTSDLSDLTKTGIDLSALNNANTWYLRITALGENGDTQGRASATVNLYKFDEISTATSEHIIDMGSVSETITNAISVVNSVTPGTTSVDFEFSSDGTNYYPGTNAEIVRPESTGTTPKLKLLITGDGSYLAQVTEYATKYNLY